jgi:hypothetical protein
MAAIPELPLGRICTQLHWGTRRIKGWCRYWTCLVWLRRTGRLLVTYYEAWATVVESRAPHGSFRIVGSRAAGTCAARAQVVVLTSHPPQRPAIPPPPPPPSSIHYRLSSGKAQQSKMQMRHRVRLFLSAGLSCNMRVTYNSVEFLLCRVVSVSFQLSWEYMYASSIHDWSLPSKLTLCCRSAERTSIAIPRVAQNRSKLELINPWISSQNSKLPFSASLIITGLRQLEHLVIIIIIVIIINNETAGPAFAKACGVEVQAMDLTQSGSVAVPDHDPSALPSSCRSSQRRSLWREFAPPNPKNIQPDCSTSNRPSVRPVAAYANREQTAANQPPVQLQSLTVHATAWAQYFNLAFTSSGSSPARTNADQHRN